MGTIALLMAILGLITGLAGAEGPTLTYAQGMSWRPPATMADGSPLVGLVGYHVYLTQTPGRYGEPARRVTNPVHTWKDTPGGMAPGQWYARVTALTEGADSQGVKQLWQSEPSAEFAFVLAGGGPTAAPEGLQVYPKAP